MTRCFASAVVLIVTLPPLVAVAAAQDEPARRSMTCTAAPMRIDGPRQSLHLTGDCPTIIVSGEGHRILVDRVGRITVSGLNNVITWVDALDRDAPAINNSGVNNVVTRAKPKPPPPAPAPTAAAPPRASTGTTGAPAAPPRVAEPTAPRERLVVGQSGQTLKLECDGRAAVVSGSRNNVTLTGSCASLSISGSGNTVFVDEAPRVSTTGHGNDVFWQRGAGDQGPRVVDTGRGNQVKRRQN